MSWGHDALMNDLADHLRETRDRIIWCDMQIGPAGSKRPDVYSVPKSYSKFCPITYEIKVSVADFRSDVTSGKWQSYLKFSSGVVFAVPAGLITKADIPPGCGLMVRGEEGWRTLKAPTLRVIPTLPHEAWMKLMIDGIERQGRAVVDRSVNPYAVEQKLRKRFGDQVGKSIAELANGPESLECELKRLRESHDRVLRRERERYQEERSELEKNRQQISAEIALLNEALGLPDGSSAWNTIFALRSARSSLSESSEIKRLNGIINRVRLTLASDCQGDPMDFLT